VHARQQAGRRQAEMKADDGGLELGEKGGCFVAERRARRGRRNRVEAEPELPIGGASAAREAASRAASAPAAYGRRS
jgi:hypothetical protein